jgi:hypothetical protein
MLDVVRQYVTAALGALPTDRAMELATQASETITAEIRKQLASLGVATKEDLDELKERVWRLESAAKDGTAKPAARRPKAAPRKKAVPVDIGGS